MLQFLSFEFIENFLYKTKTFNLKAVQEEFLLLTEFHFRESEARLARANLDEEAIR